MIKKLTYLNLILFLFLVVNLQSALSQQDEFELVESVPAETILDQSSLPRTSDVWLKMINDTKSSLDIEVFYFADEKGQPLEEIMNALKNAAGRGVNVRIIVDSSFYSNNDKSVDKLEAVENIQIKKIPLGNIAGGVMHAKYFIADKENLFIGSQNMDWRALIHIHEIGVRVKNSDLAKTFGDVFETDWLLCDGNREGLSAQQGKYNINSSNPVTLSSEKYGKIVLFPAFSPPSLNMIGLSSEETELLKMISIAQDSLHIQMYSYSPKAKNENNYYDKIDLAIREAASRNVKIKIIFSDWAIRDPATDFIKDLSKVDNIQIKFSSIPEYSGGFIPYSRVEHCKYFTVDNTISWISTSNWEWGYFYNCRNATLIIENKKVNSDLSEVFFRDWNGPYTSNVDVNKEYKSVKRN